MTMNILYVHGMGGGADSRIPGILKDWFSRESGLCGQLHCEIDVVCRTYDFDPSKSREQLSQWVEQLKPKLIIGESLGACSALRIKDIPHIFVSPSLNAPLYLGYLAPLALIPGMTPLLDRIYKPREGDRQKLHFTFKTLRQYKALRRDALKGNAGTPVFAFFGTRDHYRRSGIVSVRTWKKYFGPGSFEIYEGTHYMEEQYVHSLLIPKILLTLHC